MLATAAIRQPGLVPAVLNYVPARAAPRLAQSPLPDDRGHLPGHVLRPVHRRPPGRPGRPDGRGRARLEDLLHGLDGRLWRDRRRARWGHRHRHGAPQRLDAAAQDDAAAPGWIRGGQADRVVPGHAAVGRAGPPGGRGPQPGRPRAGDLDPDLRLDRPRGPAVRGARPAARLPVRRQQRAGRDDDHATSRWPSSAGCGCPFPT